MSRLRDTDSGEVPQRPLVGTIGAPVSFRQPAYTTQINQQANANTLGALNFTLAQMTNYLGMADIWDLYRVDYLEFTFRPQFKANNATMFANSVIPNIYAVIDLDDSSTPTFIGIQEYQSCQIHQTDDFTIRFKPAVRSGVYDGTNVVAAGTVMSPWLDTGNINIPHYGVKYGVDAGMVGQTSLQSWRVNLVVGITFKAVK